MWFGDLMVVTLVSRWLAVRKLIEIDQNEINLFHTTHWILTNKFDKTKFTKQGNEARERQRERKRGSGNNWLYVLWRIVSQNLITLHSRISAAFSIHAVSNCVGHIVHVHFYSAFNCWLFFFYIPNIAFNSWPNQKSMSIVFVFGEKNISIKQNHFILK